MGIAAKEEKIDRDRFVIFCERLNANLDFLMGFSSRCLLTFYGRGAKPVETTSLRRKDRGTKYHLIVIALQRYR
jgi:hypothetical protein